MEYLPVLPPDWLLLLLLLKLSLHGVINCVTSRKDRVKLGNTSVTTNPPAAGKERSSKQIILLAADHPAFCPLAPASLVHLMLYNSTPLKKRRFLLLLRLKKTRLVFTSWLLVANLLLASFSGRPASKKFLAPPFCTGAFLRKIINGVFFNS